MENTLKQLSLSKFGTSKAVLVLWVTPTPTGVDVGSTQSRQSCLRSQPLQKPPARGMGIWFQGCPEYPTLLHPRPHQPVVSNSSHTCSWAGLLSGCEHRAAPKEAHEGPAGCSGTPEHPAAFQVGWQALAVLRETLAAFCASCGSSMARLQLGHLLMLRAPVSSATPWVHWRQAQVAAQGSTKSQESC